MTLPDITTQSSVLLNVDEQNDRELLELAAKAAGVPAYWSTDGTVQARPLFVVSVGGAMGTMPYEEEWNPLKNDSDALRLAVNLKLPLTFINRQTVKCTLTNKYGNELWVDCGNYWDSSDSMYYPFSEKYGDDPYAATRRAIVRAAALTAKNKGCV